MSWRGLMGTIACLLTAVALLNFLVDPGAVFPPSVVVEKRIARFHAQGRNVLVAANLNERVLQKLRIQEAKPEGPRTLIVGSSRSMDLDSGIVGSPAFNVGMSGAIMKDDVAVISLALARFSRLDAVIFEVDPWIFNRTDRDARWKSLADEYEAAAPVYLKRKASREGGWPEVWRHLGLPAAAGSGGPRAGPRPPHARRSRRGGHELARGRRGAGLQHAARHGSRGGDAGGRPSGRPKLERR